MIEAEHVRAGFRAFRIHAKRLEFRLRDSASNARDPESASAAPYVVVRPGRYVLADAAMLRRVGDADVVECLRALRPADKYLEILYAPDARWRKVYVAYSLGGGRWAGAPMTMAVTKRGFWFHRVEILTSVEFAFTDGNEEWDNNDKKNYAVHLPGTYAVGKGDIVYLGPARGDLFAEK